MHPHHDGSRRYVSNPDPSPGETVEVSLELGADLAGSELADSDTVATLRTVVDGEAHWIEGTRDGERVVFELECDQPIQRYRFHLRHRGDAWWVNGHGLLDYDPDDHADFKLLPGQAVPDWVNDRVWYQIFPDRFATTGQHRQDEDWVDWSEWDDPIKSYPESMRQAYGGDLDGIIERLDHITDLGVGGVYLTPIFPARSNHRYDARTFDSIDPIVGGEEALVRLRQACEARDLKLMTDLTLNHTGDAHEWFTAARADANGVEAGFYHFNEHPDSYESWLGVSSLPKLDHRSAEMAERFYNGADSVVAKWLKPPYNLDGWRIDVANMSGRLRQLDLNQQVARATRATMDEIHSDLWLVGEHFFDAARDTPGDGWHGVMNYAGVSRPIASWLGRADVLEGLMPGPGQDTRNGVQMAAAMDVVRGVMPWSVVLGSMSLLSSHDTARWRTMCTSDDAALVGFGLLMTIPGAPCFFYGDEIGLAGDNNEASRVPMPWHSDGSWDRRFHDWYRLLIGTRNQHEALQSGGFRWVHTDADQVVFLRETADERLLVRASRGSGQPVSLDARRLSARRAEGLVNADDISGTSASATTGTGGATTLVLPADGPLFSIWSLHS